MPDEATNAAWKGVTYPVSASPRATATVVATALAGLLVATAFGTVALCAGRGLDLTDEGFYLLSYRWWNDNHDNFTGAQYFVGPVFELLGFDVARLRLFRISALVAAHTFFGLMFMAWLRTLRPAAPPSRWWNVAGAAVITTCAPAVYSWLPLTMGYNDVALLCSLAVAGCTLRVARDRELGRSAAWWAPFGIGTVAVVLALSKWSSSLVVLLGVAVTLLAITLTHRGRLRATAQLAALVTLGAVTMIGFLHFALVPLDTLLPPMLEVNRLVAGSTNSPTVLLTTYLDGFGVLLQELGRLHWLVLLVAAASPLLHRMPRAGLVAAAVAVAVTLVHAVRTDGMLGGPEHVLRFVPTLYLPLAVAGLVAAAHALANAVRTRRDRVGSAGSDRASAYPVQIRRSAVLVMVAGMPLAQAAGTGNWVHQLAVIGVGFWMALLVHLLTGLDRSLSVPRALVGAMVALLAVSTTTVAVSALWSYPYRTTGHAVSTATVDGLPAIDSLTLAPRDAAEFSALRAKLAPYLDRPGRPMIAFDRLAGMVFALDGRPVGEAWYSATAPERARQAIVRTCESGRWWGPANRPLVFFNRSVRAADLAALDACGIRLVRSEHGRKNYRYVELTFQGVPLHIFVPGQP